ncbi:MAG: hypothetical protein V2I67_14405, partial [Thermoanaerobaculales bacterium]|nr:hypothetical protein [Thermoanaerobaculales bacterium]
MRHLIGISLLFAAVVAGCSAPPEDPASQIDEQAPNVIIVLIDALRADRTGPYGFRERATTANLDAFAADSVVFERAVSQNGWTVPSVASL